MSDRKIDRLYLRYARKGDLAALGAAFDLAAPELAKVARHLARTESEAEDLVQTAFLVAVESSEQFRAEDGERRFVPWMLGILANRSRELRRRNARVPEVDRFARARVRGSRGESLRE